VREFWRSMVGGKRGESEFFWGEVGDVWVSGSRMSLVRYRIFPLCVVVFSPHRKSY
jgi:hypothetical protein